MISGVRKALKTVTPSDGFYRRQKTLHFKFKHFFNFPKKMKKNSGNGIRKNILLENPENMKKCYHEAKRYFLCFWRKTFILLSVPLLFIFLFSGAPSKMSTFQKVYFSSLCTIGKSDSFESAHFRGSAIEKVPFLKSDHFHGFALSGGWENICNLHRNNSVEILSRNTFVGILLIRKQLSVFPNSNLECISFFHPP